MVRTYKRQLGSRQYKNFSAERLQECLDAIQSKELTTREAAVKYGIARNTILNKKKQHHSKKVGGQPIFTAEEERVFEKYIVQMSLYGFPVDELDLRYIVKSYLDQTGRNVRQFRQNLPGEGWVKGFLKRQKSLTIRIAANIKRKRAAVTAATLNDYFNELEKSTVGVPASNMWNYDETNLTDNPGARKIITKRGCKYPERVMNSSKSSTSVMFCGSATGSILPPFVVYKSENLWSTWTENGPKGARYNRSKSGWFDSFCFLDWFLNHALPLLSKQVGKKVLIGDNLSTHFSPDILKACEENNIVFCALPSNSTHLTQPLDVAYFRGLKVGWKKVLDKWKNTNKGRATNTIPKDVFPSLLKELCDSNENCGGSNLVSGFRKCGIFPADRSQVLSRLPGGETSEEAVSAAFIEHLEILRGIRTSTDSSASGAAAAPSVPPKKRRKLNVPAGRGITVADLEVAACIIPSCSPPSKSTCSFQLRKRRQ